MLKRLSSMSAFLFAGSSMSVPILMHRQGRNTYGRRRPYIDSEPKNVIPSLRKSIINCDTTGGDQRRRGGQRQIGLLSSSPRAKTVIEPISAWISCPLRTPITVVLWAKGKVKMCTTLIIPRQHKRSDEDGVQVLLTLLKRL